MNFNQDASPIKFTPRKDGGYRSPDDVRTKPSGENRPIKDFKEVLSNADEEDEGQNAKSQGVEDAAAQASNVLGPVGKKKKTSLFDLTAGGANLDSDRKNVARQSKSTFKSVEENLDQLPSKSGLIEEGDEKVSGRDLPFGFNKSNDKEKFTTKFSTEQSDLSYVNPMAIASQQNQLAAQNIGKQERVEPAVNLQAIIDQLVEKTVEIKVNGRTETTVTLKHPPLFEGANIIVTSFDDAKGEFNISFENLTQQAKNILDMQVNRDSLLEDLSKRGYAVHILTATTVNEPRINIASAPPQDQGKEQREDGRGQQQQGRQQKDQRG